MSVSKSVRFEIFARDAFTCQYCGRRPPEVVLELDHIHPRAKGGSDDLTNLITACWDCNRGKSAKVISTIAPRPDANPMFLRAQQEIVEAERYLEAKEKRDSLYSQLHNVMAEMWTTLLEAEPPNEVIWNQWFNKYGYEEVELAINKCAAKAQVSDLGTGSPASRRDKCARYMNGILKKRQEDQKNNE